MEKIAWLITLVWATNVFAQEDLKQKIGAASDIKDPKLRLEAFDKVAVELKANTSIKGAGNWKTTISTSPVDDSKIILLTVESTQPFSEPGSDSKKLKLNIRLQEGKVQLFLSSHFTISSFPVDTTSRIGKGAAVTKPWEADGTFSVITYPGDMADSLTALSEADTYLARFSTLGNLNITAIFDIRGFAEAAKPIFEELKKKK